MTELEEHGRRSGLMLWAQQARVRSAACTAHAARAARSAELRRDQADRMIEQVAERNPESAQHLRAIRGTAAGRQEAIAEWRRSYAAGRAGGQALMRPLMPQAAIITEMETYLREMAVIQERGRSAGRIQASVVQRVFAVGLALQSAALTAQPEMRAEIEAAAGGLDEVIRVIRDATFGPADQLRDGEDGRSPDITSPPPG
jgi:signal transduction histidine kinase